MLPLEQAAFIKANTTKFFPKTFSISVVEMAFNNANIAKFPKNLLLFNCLLKSNKQRSRRKMINEVKVRNNISSRGYSSSSAVAVAAAVVALYHYDIVLPRSGNTMNMGSI